jgi:hypothetical protein
MHRKFASQRQFGFRPSDFHNGQAGAKPQSREKEADVETKSRGI